MAKKGSLSITRREHFPCDQKWLYSDHDIFFRELISNGCRCHHKIKEIRYDGRIQFPRRT